MLRELGHEPVEMTSAKKALEAVHRGERPDRAILDYAMPEMSGVALAELLHETYPELPMLLATGYSERERAGGNLPRLDKPYTLAELGRQIGWRQIETTTDEASEASRLQVTVFRAATFTATS
jgi:CheY-like chemotaxis protein